jgi:hypothetical protein
LVIVISLFLEHLFDFFDGTGVAFVDAEGVEEFFCGALLCLFELSEEPGEGIIGAEEGEGHQDCCGDGFAGEAVIGGGQGFECRRLVGFAEGEGGGFDDVGVFFIEEAGDEVELAAGVVAEEADEDFSEDLSTFIAGMGFEAEEGDGFCAAPHGEGLCGTEAGGGFFVGEEIDEEHEGVGVVEAGLGDADGGEAAAFGSGVDGAFLDGLALDPAGCGGLDGGDGGIPGDQGVKGGLFSFAAGVAFDVVGRGGEGLCGGDEGGGEGFGFPFFGEFGGHFEDHAVEAAVEDFGEGTDGGVGALGSAQRAQACELVFGCQAFGHF